MCFGDTEKLEVRRSTIIVVLVCLVLSLAVTLTSYNFSYMKPDIVDAAFVYRGWPLCWMIESWSYWSPPPYPHTFDFQPVNFLLDFVFWAVVFSTPIAVVLLKKAVKTTNQKH